VKANALTSFWWKGFRPQFGIEVEVAGHDAAAGAAAGTLCRAFLPFCRLGGRS